MKIIHTADLHLFSPMTANLSFDKAKIRNRELFETFERMVDFAKENGVGVLYDDIAADNPSVALFLRCGFSVKYRTDQIVMVKKVLTE